MQDIRVIEKNESLDTSLAVIRKSFHTVAEELNLTTENAPTHPSFITLDQLEELLKKGLVFYGYFLDDKEVGFVALEKADDSLYYLEKLSVLPEYRHNGYGRELVRFVLDTAAAKAAKKLSIGIIYEQTVLKDWYKDIGFRETGTRTFEHLPFTVGFLEIDLAESFFIRYLSCSGPIQYILLQLQSLQLHVSQFMRVIRIHLLRYHFAKNRCTVA